MQTNSTLNVVDIINLRVPALILSIDSILFSKDQEKLRQVQKVMNDIMVNTYGITGKDPDGAHLPFLLLTMGDLQTDENRIEQINKRLCLRDYQERYLVKTPEKDSEEAQEI